MVLIEIAKKILNVVIIIWCLTGVVIVLLRLSSLAQSVPPTGDFDAAYARQSGLTLLHILPALLLVILGPLQFVEKIRKDYRVFHRWSGRIYVVSGVIVGISALILSFVVGFAGLNGTAAILFFNILFLVFLGLAVYRISRREIAAHREWMIRAFALGLAVITTRPIFVLFKSLSGHPDPEILGVAFWLAFSLHLVLAEVWINITRKVGSRSNPPLF